MEKTDFHSLLLAVTESAINFAKRYVSDEIPPKCRYDVQLNFSQDSETLTQFDLYPEDYGKQFDALGADAVVDLLYRKGKIPVWIDISVKAVSSETTTLRLLCAGRYSDDPGEFYYESSGSGPFGIKSPNFPPGFEEGQKFSLSRGDSKAPAARKRFTWFGLLKRKK
jgi:hypothetical protein